VNPRNRQRSGQAAIIRKPRTIQSQKQKNKHGKMHGNADTQYNKTSPTVNVNTRYL